MKLALERLLGAPCYHMMEVFGHPEHVPVWRDAATAAEPVGDSTDWASLLAGYDAIVDWPGASFWRELSEYAPDAIILLSTRASAEEWWKSASRTIFEIIRSGVVSDEGFLAMWTAIAHNRFTPDTDDAAAAMAAYERHNAEVRAHADPSRLVEWQPDDGWEPLCDALGVPVPDEAFPHVNTTDDFRAMAGLDAPGR